MAIRADRQLFIRARRVRAVNARVVHIVNTAVALSARPRDVRPVDARLRVAARQFMVSSVAIGAVGGNGESALQQSFAVDALRVVLHDGVLLARIPNGGFLARAMALSTQRRNIAGERRRCRVIFAQSSVRAVAIAACWRIGTALRRQLTVRAVTIQSDYFVVADRAVHFRRHGAARFYIGRSSPSVALNTRSPGMPRMR